MAPRMSGMAAKILSNMTTIESKRPSTPSTCSMANINNTHTIQKTAVPAP